MLEEDRGLVFHGPEQDCPDKVGQHFILAWIAVLPIVDAPPDCLLALGCWRYQWCDQPSGGLSNCLSFQVLKFCFLETFLFCREGRKCLLCSKNVVWWVWFFLCCLGLLHPPQGGFQWPGLSLACRVWGHLYVGKRRGILQGRPYRQAGFSEV